MTQKYLLFDLKQQQSIKIDGGSVNTWSVKTLALSTLKYHQIETCYEYIVPIAIVIPPEATCISSNVNINSVTNLLLNLANSHMHITRILTTNLVVNVFASGLIETLSNDLGVTGHGEMKRRASMLIVYCKNYSSMRIIYNQVKSVRVPYVFVMPHEDNLYFGMEVFIKTYGQVAPDFLKTSLKIRHAHFKIAQISIKSVYTPYGVYTFRRPHDTTIAPQGGLELILTKCAPPMLNDVMPVMSMDIETIATSTNVIPMGLNSDEKVSSLVLYCVYGKSQYTLVLFLLPDRVRKSVGDEFCARMCRKYSDPVHRRIVHFKAFSSERALLYAFTKMYIRGTILSYFKLPPYHPHVLVGHNLFQYDIPFLIERYKFHDIHSQLLETGTIVMSHSEQVSFNFLENALLFDSMFLARANCLSNTYNLNAVARSRLPDHKVGKMELNSVTIRNLYNVAHEAPGVGLQTEHIEEIFRVASTDTMDQYCDPETQRLNLSTFPICYCAIDEYPLAIPCMETILAYNIQDTITVFNVMVESNIFTIIAQLTQLFGVQMNAASMRGNSYRIGACMLIEALENGQFLHSLTDKRPPDICLAPRVVSTGLSAPPPQQQQRSRSSAATAVAAAATATATATIVAREDPANSTSFAKLKLEGMAAAGKISANLAQAGFRGALNYAAQGVYHRGKSLDFKSYYPNLMCFLSCDYGSSDIVMKKDLMSLNVADSLTRLVNRGLLDLYLMSDPEDVDTADLLDPRYRGCEIGQCLNWHDLMDITDGETPILCILRDDYHTTKDSFLSKLITKLLKRRDALKAALKSETDPVQRNRLDSEQLSVKILLNSKYGLKGNHNFHNRHIPLSAAVTLFGRKFLTVCSRLIVCFQILARSEHYPEEQVAEVRTHLEYLERCVLNYKSCRQNEDLRVALGSRRQFKYEMEKFVCYVDTDGIKYTDPYNLDTNTICKQVNATLAKCLDVSNLTLSVEPTVDRLMVLTCKSYATFCFANNTVTHTGYERNVNPRIKYILNSIVRVVHLYAQPDESPLYILFDVFTHLAMANQALMFERVKLNRHKNESTLQRYICSVTRDFRGDVATVLLLDAANVQRDWYMTHAEWINSPNPPPINTYKFIRKNFLILLRLIFIDAVAMETTHLRHEPTVASLLLKHNRDRYGGNTTTMKWANVKIMGLLAYILSQNCTKSDAHLELINKHAKLYEYCEKVYTEYKQRVRIKIDKQPDVTRDGLKPKCLPLKFMDFVYYDLLSVFE